MCILSKHIKQKTTSANSFALTLGKNQGDGADVILGPSVWIVPAMWGGEAVVGRGSAPRDLDRDDAADCTDLVRQAVPDRLGRSRDRDDGVAPERGVDLADVHATDGTDLVQRGTTPVMPHGHSEVASAFVCRLGHEYSPWSLDIHADCVGARVYEKALFVKGFFINRRGS